MREAGEIDVRATIDSTRFGRYQALIAALCMLVTFFDGYDTQSIGYVAPLMAKDLGLGMASFGPIFAAGLIGLMLGAMTRACPSKSPASDFPCSSTRAFCPARYTVLPPSTTTPVEKPRDCGKLSFRYSRALT
jgi:hypothetical protein